MGSLTRRPSRSRATTHASWWTPLGGSAVDELAEPEEQPAPTRPNPFDALRELSSFDDLTDQLAY